MPDLPELPDGWINPDVDLVGVDSNAFAVMGTVSRALRRAGNPREVIDSYRAEAMSDDYDHLLRTSMLYGGMLSDE